MEIGGAIVFGIEEDDVYAHLGCFLLYLTGYFEQYTHAAGAVVNPQNVFSVVLFVGVVVGIGAAVPVCAEHDALAAVGLVGTDDVAGFQRGAVPGSEVGILVIYLGAKGFQLLGQVFATIAVGLCVGHARTEVGLCLHIRVGAVGIELGCLDNDFLFGLLTLVGLLGVSTGHCAGEGKGEGGEEEQILYSHLCCCV